MESALREATVTTIGVTRGYQTPLLGGQIAGKILWLAQIVQFDSRGDLRKSLFLGQKSYRNLVRFSCLLVFILNLFGDCYRLSGDSYLLFGDIYRLFGDSYRLFGDSYRLFVRFW